MLYGSETWCLREKEMHIFRTERAIMRAICGAKLADRKNTEDMMDMLGLNQTIDKMAKASGVRWFGACFEKRGWRCSKECFRTEKNVEKVEERLKADLNLKDAHNRTKWRESACNFHEVNPATSIKWGKHRIMASSISHLSITYVLI